MGTKLLYLVRHGEQDRPPGGGEADTGLSDRGRKQAALLGHRLSGLALSGPALSGSALSGAAFDVIRHSPLRRAAETAGILADCLSGVPAGPSDLLADRTPVPPDLDLTGMPAEFRAFLSSVPGDERDPGAARLDEAVTRLAVAGPEDRREILVTHNFVIGWFVRRALDAPDWRWIGLNQLNCALTIIEVRAGRPPMLICFNDAGHLAGGAGGRAPAARG